jgi:hypothetical protein
MILALIENPKKWKFVLTSTPRVQRCELLRDELMAKYSRRTEFHLDALDHRNQMIAWLKSEKRQKHNEKGFRSDDGSLGKNE